MDKRTVELQDRLIDYAVRIINLKIIVRAKLIDATERLTHLLAETDELIAILVTSARTARRNANMPTDENNR